MDSLRSGERVEASEQQNRCLSVANIPSPVVHVASLRPTLILGANALRVIYLDAPPSMRGSRLKGLVVGRRGRRAMGRRRRHRDEGKVWIDERASMLCRRELGEAKALRSTLINRAGRSVNACSWTNTKDKCLMRVP